MNTLRTLALAALFLTVATMVAAADITREPGYFDLEWIAIPDDADEIQYIDLSAMLTEVAAKARTEGDDELVGAVPLVPAATADVALGHGVRRASEPQRRRHQRRPRATPWTVRVRGVAHTG